MSGNTTSAAGSPSRTVNTITGDDDTFAGRESICLEHERKSESSFAHHAARDLQRLDDFKPRRRHTVTRHEILREGLARFETRSGRSGPEQQPAVIRKAIGD